MVTTMCADRKWSNSASAGQELTVVAPMSFASGVPAGTVSVTESPA
jgi:hypothetical protein